MGTASVNRVTGLSGIDTETMVTQIMTAEREKYNNMLRKQKWTTWQQESYRETITALQDFQTKFLQTGANTIRYSKTFNNYKNTVSANGEPSTAIKINSSKSNESFTLKIAKLAAADSYKGQQVTTKNLVTSNVAGIYDSIAGIKSGKAADVYNKTADIKTGNAEDIFDSVTAGEGNDLSFKINLDGTSRQIQITKDDLVGGMDESAIAALTSDDKMAMLKNAISTKLGSDTPITLNTNSEDGTISFGLSNNGDEKHTLSISDASDLGISGTKATQNQLSFKVKLGSEEHEIKINKNELDGRTENEKLEIINSKLNEAFGDGKVSASKNSDGTLNFGTALGENSTLTISEAGDLGISRTTSNQNSISFKVNLDGVEKNIKITAADLNAADGNSKGEKLQSAINSKLSSVFGDKVSTTLDNNKLSFDLRESGHTLTVSGADSLGIKGTKTNKVSLSSKVSDITGSRDPNTIYINNKRITIGANDTVADIQNKLKSEAGVELKYASATGSFTLTSLTSGENGKINIGSDANTQSFLEKLGFNMTERDADNKLIGYTEGSDLTLEINGVRTTRTSNTFDIGDMNITISDFAEVGKTYEVRAEDDVDKTFENIKTFIDEYNQLISDINGKVKETRMKSDFYSYYEPMTDEEEATLTEEQIEKWNKAAKTGLLYRDSSLNDMLEKLRMVMYSSVKTSDGSSISLYQIGITTTSDFSKGGYLEIDEDKLRESIAKYGDRIEELFTKSDVGIGDQVKSVVDRAIGTNGTLREKAGIPGSASEFTNNLTKELKDIGNKLIAEKERLFNRENYYYELFSAMEQAVTLGNNQMGMLQSMFS